MGYVPLPPPGYRPPPRGPGLVERFSAWIALQADRFADRLEDWADGLETRHEAPVAPDGPYRSPPVPRDHYATGGAGHRIMEVLELPSKPWGPDVVLLKEGEPYGLAKARSEAGFLAEVARRDPRLAVALLGSVPPAPPAGKCSNCGAPHESACRACRYCGVERAGPRERPRPSAGKSYIG